MKQNKTIIYQNLDLAVGGGDAKHAHSKVKVHYLYSQTIMNPFECLSNPFYSTITSSPYSSTN